MSVSLSLPDGGESVAVFTSLFLILILAPDSRAFGWSRFNATGNINLRAIGYVGSLLLCLQIAGIYFESGLSKIAVEQWADGTAMYYIVRDPMFGTAGIVGGILRYVTDIPIGSAALTWGTIVLECCIATAFLCVASVKRYGLVVVILLHTGIAVAMGLWSFALVMIATAMVASYQLESSQARASDTGHATGSLREGAKL